MNDQLILPGVGRDTTRGEIIKLACLAVGGQGGGVIDAIADHGDAVPFLLFFDDPLPLFQGR